MIELTHWVHDLSPFIFRFGEDWGIRYYGLAYALAFVTAAWLLRIYFERAKSPLDSKQQGQLLTLIILGVVVGGRLGYFVFYTPALLLTQPWEVLKIWEGGMSSHGGFLGVFGALWWFAQREQMGWLRLSDIVVTLAPPGLFLGRIANFINGELWGKVTTVPWAVIFPQSAEPGTPLHQIAARHPSQLYQAMLEGLLLTIFTQWRFWKTDVREARPGRLSGEFLVLYAIGRTLGEAFREPDASLLFGLSRGTFYSLFVALLGCGLMWKAGRPPINPDTLYK